MKVEQWIKSNRLMPELKDFPDSYFHDLYNRIKAKRIQLRDEEGFMEDALRRDTKQIIAKLQNMMKDQTTFFHSAFIGHVKPMFEICWCAMIAAFSVVLEQAEVRAPADEDLINLWFRIVAARSICACRASAVRSAWRLSFTWRPSVTHSYLRSQSSPCSTTHARCAPSTSSASRR